MPPGSATDEDLRELNESVWAYKAVTSILKKQRDSGVWARNMLGLAPSKTLGISDVGTIHQYRKLLELGLDGGARPFRLTNRVLFRLLSRDEDSSLLFEHKKIAQAYPGIAPWFRNLLREAATCALAQAGLGEDPRVRGAAHRIATDVSHFLRSDLADNPLEKRGAKWVLREEVNPPSVFSVAMISYVPSFQRDRAGFVDRLGEYLGRPAPKKDYALQFGRKSFPPSFYLLGEPLAADSAGRPKDLPLALHWIETLARLDALEHSPVAKRILARLLRDCNSQGVWTPKNLSRGFAPSPSKIANFCYPLENEARLLDQRRADVTFRLAMFAKLLNWDLEYS